MDGAMAEPSDPSQIDYTTMLSIAPWRLQTPPVKRVPGVIEQTQTASKFDTFSCFPHLPTELRLMIWKACAHVPRVLVLHQKRLLGDRVQHLLKIESHSQNPSPIVLRICREARDTVMKANIYEMILGTRVIETPAYEFRRLGYCPRLFNTFIDHPITNYNRLADTIYISRMYCDSLKFAFRTHLHLLMPSVAVDLHAVLDHSDPNSELFAIFHDHPIEEVIVVIRQEWNVPTGFHGELTFMELESEDDIENGRVGVARVQKYYDRFMECKPYGFTADMVREAALQVANSATEINPERLGVRLDMDKFEDDVEPAEEVFVVRNAPRFRAMGVARGGVRL